MLGEIYTEFARTQICNFPLKTRKVSSQKNLETSKL